MEKSIDKSWVLWLDCIDFIRKIKTEYESWQKYTSNGKIIRTYFLWPDRQDVGIQKKGDL